MCKIIDELNNIMGNTVNVIVVEDDIEIAKIVGRVLQDASWVKVHVANNSDEFWSLYSSLPKVSAVILDLFLTNSINDGIALAEKLRQINDDIFIFVMTGYENAIDNIRLLNSGIDDFILKPFRIEILKSKLYLLFSRIRRWEHHEVLRKNDISKFEKRLDLIKEIVCKAKKILEEGKDFTLLSKLQIKDITDG